MRYARYYVMPRRSQPTPLSFTAPKPWIQVAIRGADPEGKAIKNPPLEVQQGGGTLGLSAGCVYEMYFSDVIIGQEHLDALEAAEGVVISDDIVFSPPLGALTQVAGAQDPPPPPPPGSAPNVPFDMKNVYRINP